MTKHELHTIIQSGEGYTTEFKRNVNTDLTKELVAFANASGGRIFIGIEDDGTVTGIKSGNALRSKVQMMAHDCDPSIQIELEVFETILIIEVAEGKNKPYRCTNGFYIRNGASTIKLSTSEIIDFIKTEGKIKFDELRMPQLDYSKDIDEAAINRYIDLLNLSSPILGSELLINLGVVYHDYPAPVVNNTAVLFFAKYPIQFIPQAVVTCVLYKGNGKVDIIDKKTFEFDIISNIDESLSFLKRHLNTAYEIKEKRRKEIMEIPEVVLREAIVNAVAHRDYFEKGANVMIEVFDNRVEISNPGGLPKGLTAENFGTRTLARNPLIAALLNRVKYIEKLGTGIQRMRDEMKKAGLPEPDFTFDGFFTIFLHRAEEKINFIPELNVSISQRQRMLYILKQLQTKKRIDLNVVAEKFNTNIRTIQRDLKILNEKGWILFLGTTRSRNYYLSKAAIEKLKKGID